MSRRLTLTYGSDSIQFQIPEASLAGEPIRPRENAPLPGAVAEVLGGALGDPVDRPRLREGVAGKRVGIVISDEFRSGLQHAILDALLDEVVAGQPARVLVACATGTHRPDVYAKAAAGWVAEARERLGVPIDYLAHDAENGRFVDLGSTPMGTRVRVAAEWMACQVRVYGHESKHHYLNGYSCVDKQLLPGLCCRETVATNHKRALHPSSGGGRSPWSERPERRENPFAEDARDARALSERMLVTPDGELVEQPVDTFALDMISSGEAIYWIRAGDPAAVCREMTRTADALSAFEVRPTRYVIVSPGGPPASQALYGTQNCFDLALKGAIEPGGEALVVAPLDGRPDLPQEVRGLAPGVRPKELFWDNLVRLRGLELEQARQEIDENFQLYLWKTDRVLRLLNGQRVRIWIHSSLPAETLAPGGFEVAQDVQAWVDERVARGDGTFTVIDQGNKLLVTPEA